MKIYAHRGASNERPENTIAAFQRALALGVFGIELDVHLTSDGAAVVIHDETVDRTTDGSGSIDAMTLAELRRLDAGDGERVPTLAEVLDLVASAAHVDIEVKAPAAAAAVLEEAGRRREMRWAMSSFDHEVLRFVRSRSLDVELWPLVVDIDHDAITTALDLRSPLLAVHDSSVSGDVVASVSARNLGLWVWTVNDPDRAMTLGTWGVEGICTDKPASISAALSDT